MRLYTFAFHLQELNEMLLYLPQQHTGDKYAEKLKSSELCRILLSSVPKGMSQQYFVTNAADVVPSDWTKLVKNLKQLEQQFNLERARTGDKPNGEATGSRATRKAVKANCRGHGPKHSRPDNKKKHCTYCKQYGGPYWTHNTVDCHRKPHGYRGQSAHGDDYDGVCKSAWKDYKKNQKESLKDLHLQLKKLKKKVKRSTNMESDSDSDA